jgi:PEP-CTERM motif
MKMKLFRSMAVAVAAAACAGGAFAQASVPFLFDPDGAGGAFAPITADRFDWAPGSAYAVGAIPTAANDPFTLYYQANLSAVQLGSGNVFNQGVGGITFNAVAGFGEITTAVVPVGAGAVATFGFDGGNPVNYFRICTGSGNNLSGAGFGCTAANAILTGVVNAIPSSSFNVPNFGNTALLDSNGADDWAGQQTVVGSGTTDIRVNIASVNMAYFPSFDVLQSLIISFFNSSQVLPYLQVDPSRTMFTGAGSVATAGLGAVNGINGPNMLFQADANQSFSVQQKVPEPGTLALIGLALAGLGAARRRKA